MNIILSYYHHITIILPPYYHHIIMILPLSYYHIPWTSYGLLYPHIVPFPCSQEVLLAAVAVGVGATFSAPVGGVLCHGSRGGGGAILPWKWWKNPGNMWKNMGSLRKNSCRTSKISERKWWNFSFFATFPKNSPGVWRIPGYPEVAAFFVGIFGSRPCRTHENWDMGDGKNKHQ